MPFAVPRHRRPHKLGQATLRWVAGAILLLGMLALPAAATGTTTLTIRISDRLEPANVSIAPGLEIRWINASQERHRMRSQSGPARFDSGNLEPGESFSVRLTAPGSYAYLDERADDDANFFGRIVVTTALDKSTPIGPVGPPPTGPSAVPSTASVGMAGRAFGPNTVRIARGGTVTWSNDDDREHTVTSTSGSFDSGVLAEGATWDATFETTGTFAYLCAIHPEMTGTVVVGDGNTSEPAEPPASPTPAPSPTPDAAVSPSPVTELVSPVEVRDFEFVPGDMTVTPGSQVTWTNLGFAPHTVTAEDASFDSGTLAAGESFTRTFEAAGETRYVCSFHPEMAGVIRVVATGGATGSDTAGNASGDDPVPLEPAAAAAPSAGDAAQPASQGDTGSGLRLGLVVLVLSTATGLFVRTIRGTVRTAE